MPQQARSQPGCPGCRFAGLFHAPGLDMFKLSKIDQIYKAEKLKALPLAI